MSASSPALSILTPVWNGLPYIKECIESVIMQKSRDWELIISDNGSTDGTQDYLDTVADPRIRVFKQEKNLGIGGNLNFLISKAKAPIAYILCADDYLYKDAIEQIVLEWSQLTSEIGFIRFNWKEVRKHSEFSNFSYNLLPKKLDSVGSQFAFFAFGNIAGNLSNVSAKVEILRTSGGFDERFKLAVDFELWSRIANSYSIVLSETATAYVRRHEGVATNYLNKSGQSYLEQIAIYESLIRTLIPLADRGRLVKYFNIQIASFHLRGAIISLLKGHLGYFKTFLSPKSSICWPKWIQLIVCLPFALSEKGRYRMGAMMAKRIMNDHRRA